MTRTLCVERLLAAPGHAPAMHDVALRIEGGRIAEIGALDWHREPTKIRHG